MMYIHSYIRYNPKIKDKDLYHVIFESYRNSKGKICSEVMLEIGFMEESLTHYQRDTIAEILNSRMRQYEGSSSPRKDESKLTPKNRE